MTDVKALAQELCDALETQYNTSFPNSLIGKSFAIETGRKYFKIVMADRDGTNYRSVHAFVDKSNGLLYKAASWAAPAKGARYDLTNGTPDVDWAGGYLYR